MPMNEELTWGFDVAAFEWLIALIMLAVVSVVVIYRVFKAFKKQDSRPSDAAPVSEVWHAEETDTVFKLLKTAKGGLSTDEAAHRLAEYGPNRLPEARSRGPLIRFFYQFHNVLIYVLLVASAVTAMLEHWVDASVILGVVFINAVIGFVQEGKAEDALRAIRQMLSPNAMVVRDGRQVSIQAEELTPGDIVLLQSGDKVPADMRLFRVKGLQIQESVLTGESMAVEKITDPIAQETVIGDRRCMAYSGTLVTHGQGTGVVVATGEQTEFGRMFDLV